MLYEKTCLDFVRIQVQTGFVCVRLAYTERFIEDLQGARQGIENAHKALAIATRFFAMLKDVTSAEVLNEIAQGIKDLREAIEGYDSA